MPNPLVIITHSLPQEWIAPIANRVRAVSGPEDALVLAPDLEEHLGQAEGLFCLLAIPVPRSLLKRMPKLRVVSNMAVGVDNIDVAACTERGIPVGYTPGVLTDATADLTMALLLSAARRLAEASQDARQGRWHAWRPAGWLGVDLHESTLGIIGLGKIGCAVARRARGFGMGLMYTDPNPNLEAERTLGISPQSLDELLARSDFISLHCPLTPETRGLIDERAFRKMKPHAILINAARGAIVVTRDLVRALNEGWIAAAALDVTDPEPLPPNHPLFSLGNCLVLPHIGSATHGTRRRMAEVACENLLAGLEGRQLPYCVNPEVYAGRERFL